VNATSEAMTPMAAVPVQEVASEAALTIRIALRYGARIDLTHQGQTFQLLSVHLKSGCVENASTSSACAMLLEQIPVLEGWIDAAAQGLCRSSCSGTSTAASPSPMTRCGRISTTATRPTPTSPR
jgi:hypothetical protein